MIVVASRDALENHSKLLSALANHKRLQIMQIISEQEVGVGDLAKKVGLSQSALSQHLARLRNEKLVATRRDAQNVYYSSDHAGVRTILNSLKSIERGAADSRPETKTAELDNNR
jgi:ArsR family transcriptional regulator, virulence genes transcriptional regulator